MITRSLVELIFSASNIERWNDHPRPVQFTEMAKQAHKFIIAYVIARHEQDKGKKINWQRLIEGGIFEFLHRIIITDIKPPIFHRLMSDEKKRKELNNWVMEKLNPVLSPLPGGFESRCRDYFMEETSFEERKYLQAAHYLATKWEFGFIYNWSSPIFGIEKTREEIERQVKEYAYIDAVKLILRDRKGDHSNGGLAGFISLVGQLRFQKRWAQTPRIPQTSVLGHLLFVAILSWLITLELDGCPSRRYNAFYGGLFHDLPEVLTRDIVSPVKRSIEGLDQMIKDLEMEAISNEILPLIPKGWHDEILSFVRDEFENKTWPEKKGIPQIFEDQDCSSRNDDRWNLTDGKIIEACDKLAAFIEASQSVRLGIKSNELLEGKRSIYEKFYNKTVNGYPVGVLFDYFR